jgi:hypothetical protein
MMKILSTLHPNLDFRSVDEILSESEALFMKEGEVITPMTAPHPLRDLADVQDLISVLGLPLELGE